MTIALETTNTSHPRLRTTWALVAGFGAVFVLSSAADAILHALNYYPNDGTAGTDGELAVALAYRTLFTIIGGAITGLIAGTVFGALEDARWEAASIPSVR